MRRHGIVRGLAAPAVAWIALACAASPADAKRSPARPAEPPAAPSAAGTRAPVAERVEDFDLRLARAAERFAAGDPWGVFLQLDGLPLDSLERRPGADRAAFLLAQAHRATGSREGFARVAECVSRWSLDTGYTRWLASQWVLDRAEAEGAIPAGAADLFPSNAGFARAFAALAAGDSSAAPEGAALVTTTAAGADLAGALAIRAAARSLARGEDPRARLAAVPPHSRYRERALRIAATISIERGEPDSARADLERVAASPGPGRGEAWAALAGLEMDAGRWASAESLYALAEADWRDERDSLAARLAAGRFDDLWEAWRRPRSPSPAFPLRALLSDDLGLLWSRGASAAPDPGPADPAPRHPIAPPPAADWLRIGSSERGVEEARASRYRYGRAAEDERARLAAVRRYLSWGDRNIAREDSTLGARAGLLAGIAARLDEWDRRLARVRDEAIRRIAARARALAEEGARQRLALAGMRRIDLAGPSAARAPRAPAGIPDAAVLVGGEEAFADSVVAIARRIEVEGPESIRRSYEQAWRPALIDRVGLLATGYAEARGHAARLDAALDSALADAAGSVALRDLEARFAAAGRLADSLGREHAALANRVARAAVVAARAAHEERREGLEYGLAAASYAASVGAGAPGEGAPGGPAGVADSVAGATRNHAASANDAAEAVGARALRRLERFLTDQPQSVARAEVRFRLADLLLIRERGAFRERMAEYVRRQGEGLDPGPLPVSGDVEALGLYRAILREDPGFAHLDAVRFNVGMLLAESGDPEAEVHFTDLLRLHPGSAYAQEGAVRLGDLRFASRRFREASDLYARAASGPDPTLGTVATYKLGWAGFRDERFLDAAVAFRDVLDRYASEERAAIRADVEKEAETTLVQALARAGGAQAFTELFDGSRPRPHEERVLASLANQFRRYDRHADAIEADRMALARYPSSPGALAAARRMAAGFERWNDPAAGRDALRELAPRFAPGGAWAAAQASDSVRRDGAEFARRAWLSLAAHHLAAARSRDGLADWREALALYETLLERFGDDPGTPRLRLHAAEAAARLERYPVALSHLARASRSGDDSLRVIADWQAVAVTDAWYARRRGGRPDGFEPAADSLGRAVLAAADRFRDRHPGDPRLADLAWRQGQIALAHGWHERAAADFGRLAERHPADRRAPEAAALRADALFRLDRFADAGAAYAAAHALARAAGADSLARRTGDAVPISYYRHAEAAVAADSTAFETHARRFERVAKEWPADPLAEVARYRAARAWLRAGRDGEGVRVLRELAERHPDGEFARDAHLELARALERQGHRDEAATALARFAAAFPADSSAGDAMLQAADLYQAAGREAPADSMRLAYVRRFPADLETAMEVHEGLARRELARVGPGLPLASLLPPPPAAAAKPVRGAKPPAARPVPASRLAEYLGLAQKHPEFASRPLLAEIRFRQGEEARAAGNALAIGLPLERSLPPRQKLLDEAIAHYRASADYGVAEWAHASACRIGQALVEFGTALERSERPADLKGDDLLAYEDVLFDRSQVFHDRGEGVWVELLRQKGRGEAAGSDPWIAEARGALWARLGLRFAYRPEVAYPLVGAQAPARPRPAKAAKAPKPGKRPRGGDPAGLANRGAAVAEGEGR